MAHQGAQPVLGADLFGDVDAEAEHVGIAPGRLDEFVAVGNDAHVAVDVAEVKHALHLAFLHDFAEVAVEADAAILGDELGEPVAGHVLAGAADALRTVSVDGEQDAVEVVGANHAERPFDELAITRLALAQGILGGTLHGDIDAGGDDEVDLAAVVDQRRGRPGNAAQASVAMHPLVLEGDRDAVGAQALEVLDGGGDVGVGDELVPQVAPDQGREVVSGSGLAGAVEADDAAGSVEDSDQGVDGVEHGGDEVALDGQGGFDALARAGNALHLAHGVIEFDRGHGLAAEHGEGLLLKGSKPARWRVHHEKRADADSGGRDQRSAGIEVEVAAGQDDASRSEFGMLAGVRNFVDAQGAERRARGQAAQRQVEFLHAVASVDSDAIGQGEGNPGHRSIANLCCKLGQVVDRGVRGGVDDLIPIEGLDTQGLTARNVAFCQCAVHLTPIHGRRRNVLRHWYFRGTAWYFGVLPGVEASGICRDIFWCASCAMIAAEAPPGSPERIV